MRWKKGFLIVQAALCVLLAGMLCWGAVSLYREGAARKARNPLEAVFTPEGVAARFAPARPVLYATAVLAAAGLLLRVREEGENGKARALTPPPLPPRKAEGGRNRARLLLLAAALLLIGMGAANGSMKDVLLKAINICSECVGLG